MAIGAPGAADVVADVLVVVDVLGAVLEVVDSRGSDVSVELGVVDDVLELLGVVGDVAELLGVGVSCLVAWQPANDRASTQSAAATRVGVLTGEMLAVAALPGASKGYSRVANFLKVRLPTQ